MGAREPNLNEVLPCTASVACVVVFYYSDRAIRHSEYEQRMQWSLVADTGFAWHTQRRLSCCATDETSFPDRETTTSSLLRPVRMAKEIEVVFSRYVTLFRQQ